MSLGSWLAAEWEKVKAFLTREEQIVVQVAGPILSALATEAGQVLMVAAKAAVTAIEAVNPTAPGSTKFDAAKTAVLNALSAGGHDLADHVVNAGIELVVGSVKASLPAQAALPAPATVAAAEPAAEPAPVQAGDPSVLPGGHIAPIAGVTAPS